MFDDTVSTPSLTVCMVSTVVLFAAGALPGCSGTDSSADSEDSPWLSTDGPGAEESNGGTDDDSDGGDTDDTEEDRTDGSSGGDDDDSTDREDSGSDRDDDSTGGSDDEVSDGRSCETNSDCPDGKTCNVVGDYDDSPEDPTRRCGPPRCDCANQSEAFCSGNVDHDVCIVPRDTCRINGCPDGYECDEYSGNCECGRDEGCKTRCREHSDCGLDTEFSCVEGICRLERCETDAECDAGRVCGRGELYQRVCRHPGDRKVGEDCHDDHQCATGYCMDDICVEPCTSNADCGDGRECAVPEAHGPIVPFCQAGSCGDCGADEYCAGEYYGCNMDPCPDGRCCRGVPNCST